MIEEIKDRISKYINNEWLDDCMTSKSPTKIFILSFPNKWLAWTEDFNVWKYKVNNIEGTLYGYPVKR